MAGMCALFWSKDVVSFLAVLYGGYIIVCGMATAHTHAKCLGRACHFVAAQAGSTPLHWAARGGHIECVTQLLAVSNVEVNAQNKMGDTALHGSAWKGEAQVTAMLLEKGAHTNIKNNDDQTPYELASRSPETQALLRSNQNCTLGLAFADACSAAVGWMCYCTLSKPVPWWSGCLS